jgi:hypothetical protein
MIFIDALSMARSDGDSVSSFAASAIQALMSPKSFVERSRNSLAVMVGSPYLCGLSNQRPIVISTGTELQGSLKQRKAAMKNHAGAAQP